MSCSDSPTETPPGFQVFSLAKLRKLTPEGVPPDGNAVEVKLLKLLDCAFTQIPVGAALGDSEDELSLRTWLFPALRRPAQRQVQRPFGLLVGCRPVGAFVKAHGDVGADALLDCHGLLRPHEERASVDMGLELDALGGELAEFCKGEDLESP